MPGRRCRAIDAMLMLFADVDISLPPIFTATLLRFRLFDAIDAA